MRWKSFNTLVRRATRPPRAADIRRAGRLARSLLDASGALVRLASLPLAAPEPKRPTKADAVGRRHARLSDAPAARPPAGGHSRPAAQPVPTEAVFRRMTFAPTIGARDYWLYIPSRLAAVPPSRRKAPVLLALHGCRQDARDFARGTRFNALAETYGLLVAYPEQPRSANANACWNWFEPAHQAHGSGEPAILAGIAEAVVGEEGGDPARVFVAGLSAGGAMAAILAKAYPGRFAAVGIHSGLAAGAASGVSDALQAMRRGPTARGAEVSAFSSARGAGRRPRLIVFHGSRDRTVVPENAAGIVSAHGPGPSQRTVRRTGKVTGGRAFTVETVRDAAGRPVVEDWRVDGLAHAWSGGSPDGSFTDPNGPDASAEMLRFFLGRPSA